MADGGQSYVRVLPGGRYLAVAVTPGTGTWYWTLRGTDPGSGEIAHGEGFASAHLARLHGDYAALALSAPRFTCVCGEEFHYEWERDDHAGRVGCLLIATSPR
jgi:hypothetical protein